MGACKAGYALSKSGAKVTPPSNAESPSSIKEGSKIETTELPAGSTIVDEKIEATATTPAVERRTTTVAKDTVQKTVTNESEVTVSPPRPPDTTVELYKARAEDRKPLLYWAGGALVAGIVARGFAPSWPSISNGLFAIAAIFLGAWKFAEIPWQATLGVVVLVVVMIMFYKRGQWDKDGDGIPDLLQKLKRQPPTQPLEPPAQ